MPTPSDPNRATTRKVADSAIAATTLPRILRDRAAASPHREAQWSLDPDAGRWSARTWLDFERHAASVAIALRESGLCPGDRVGIIAPSSARWDWMQMGVLGARGVVVGLDPHDLSARLGDIVQRAGITVLIAATSSLAARVGHGARTSLRLTVSLDGEVDGAGDVPHPFRRMLEPLAEAPDDWDRAEPDDTATILFTSGTTGEPKGIAYTHRQTCLAAGAILDAFADIREGSHLACWLPLSNIFQRIVNICAIGRGAQVFYIEDPRDVMRWLTRIDPDIFIGVPRFYEKLYAGICERVAASSWVTRRLVRWAMAAGADRADATRRRIAPGAADRLRYAAADALVLQRIRRIMGRELRYMISGSAPMPRSLLERFDALGFTVLEGYALSENIVPVAANTVGATKPGTVGRPLPGNEVKIASDGEVLVRGPGVFAGYYGETPAGDPLDDGFLATGDLGELDPDGYLTLTGRKSEIVKTSTGRRVAPAPIESILRQVHPVEHAVVFGAGRAVPIALLSIAPPVAAGQGRSGDESACPLLATWPRLRVELVEALRELPSYLRPRGLVLTTRPLTIESGELTSNLKLRRTIIERAYAPYLAELDRRLDVASGDTWPIAIQSDVVLCRL